MQDSIYHMTIKSRFISNFALKRHDFAIRKRDILQMELHVLLVRMPEFRASKTIRHFDKLQLSWLHGPERVELCPMIDARSVSKNCPLLLNHKGYFDKTLHTH